MKQSHAGAVEPSLVKWIGAMCLVFLCTKISFAQNISTPMGARSMAMGNASSCLADEWSIWNNPAGLAPLALPAISFSFDKRHALRGIDRLAAGAVIPVRIGRAGTGFFRFGDDFYSEQLLSLAFANRLGSTSMGVRCEFTQYRAEGFDTRHSFGITFGFISLISPKLTFAAFATNINQPRHMSGERLPIKMAAGLCLKPLGSVVILAELEKDLAFEPTLKGAMEYSVHKKFWFRTGFNLFPHAGFFGWGVKAWRMQIDYSIKYAFAMGYSQQASITVVSKRKSKPGHEKKA